MFSFILLHTRVLTTHYTEHITYEGQGDIQIYTHKPLLSLEGEPGRDGLGQHACQPGLALGPTCIDTSRCLGK